GLGEKRVREVVAEIVLEHSDPGQVRERCERAARRPYVQIAPQRHGMARMTAVMTAFSAAQIEAVVQAAAESARAAGSTTPIGALRAVALAEAVNYYCDALTGDPPREVAPAQEVLLDEAGLAAIDVDTGRTVPGSDPDADARERAVSDPAASPQYPPGPLGT